MKKYIVILVFLSSTITVGQAQPTSSCVRNISTNPLNPINEEWGTTIFPGISNYYVNTGFNWYPPGTDFGNVIVIDPSQNWATPYSSQSNPIFMKSPYRTENGHGSKYLWAQLTDIYDADFAWEDGWELLYMNLGIYPNGNKINLPYSDHWLNSSLNNYVTGPTPDNAPYFILYNRYRGVLRVFANVWFTDNSTGSQEDITVELILDGSVPDQNQEPSYSGVFRLANGLDQTLDKPTDIVSLVSPRRHPGGSSNTNQWVAADFQIAYDPCQCYTPTKFEIRFKKRDIMNVDLTQRTISYDRDLNDLNDDELNFFQTMVDAEGNVIAPGNVAYGSIQDLLVDYKKALEKYNNELNDYYSLRNQGKKLIIDLVQSGLGIGLKGMVNAFDNMSASDKEDIKKTLKENDLSVYAKVGETSSSSASETPEEKEKKKKESEFGKEVTKAGKKLLASQFDFLNAALGIKEKPVKPQTPQATFTEGRITGTIERSLYEPAGPFFVPGTVPTASINPNLIEANNFPAYNNVMGMFALMKTPELMFYNQDSDFEITGNALPTFYEFNGEDGPYSTPWKGTFQRNQSLRFMVPYGLTYTINPALDWDLEKTSFLVSFVIEVHSDIGNLGDLDDVELKFLNPTNFEILHQLPMPNNRVNTVLASDYYNIDDIKNRLFALDIETNSKAEFILRSSNNPDEIEDGINEILNQQRNSRFKNSISSIKMKIIADMYFDQIGYFKPDPNDPSWQGEQVNTFQVRTFELYNKNKPGSIEEQLRGEIVEEYQLWSNYIPGTTVLNSEIAHYDHRVKEVDATTNTIIIRAEKVKVTGEVKPAAGYNLRIEAMTDIKVLEGGKLLPNVVAKIVPDFYGHGSNPPATSAQVATFCTGQNPVYGANNPGKRAQEIIEANERERQLRAEKAKMAVTIYPNPTTNYVQVSVKNQPQGVANLQFALFDITGRQVFQTEEEANSQGQYTLQLPQLSGGIYMLHIKAGQQTSVEKVVIK